MPRQTLVSNATTRVLLESVAVMGKVVDVGACRWTLFLHATDVGERCGKKKSRQWKQNTPILAMLSNNSVFEK